MKFCKVTSWVYLFNDPTLRSEDVEIEGYSDKLKYLSHTCMGSN